LVRWKPSIDNESIDPLVRIDRLDEWAALFRLDDDSHASIRLRRPFRQEMADRESNRPVILRRAPFAALSIGLAFGFAFLAFRLFALAGKSNQEFFLKLGEHTLQIAVFVLIGAAVKEFIDWRVTEKARHAKDTDLRRDFLRRLREIHVQVMLARDLMLAHYSAKTWAEKSRDLIELTHEVEELQEDLNASPDLFEHQPGIQKAVNEILAYLELAKHEYIKNHDQVDSDWKNGLKLGDTVEKCDMSWFADFSAGSNLYGGYLDSLTNAKGAMRRQVYRAEGGG
jgi:hypothetical protein